jgi:hypothetical protein
MLKLMMDSQKKDSSYHRIVARAVVRIKIILFIVDDFLKEFLYAIVNETKLMAKQTMLVRVCMFCVNSSFVAV